MSNSAFSFTKSERVCGRGECNALFTGSESLFCFPFKVIYRLSGSGEGLRVLISAPKRYHKRAVRRNKIKRRTREAFRLNKHIYYEAASAAEGDRSVDLCLIYISKKQECYDVIDKSVRRAISEVTKIVCQGGDSSGDGAC